MLIQIPFIVLDTLGYDLKEAGFISAAPYLGMALSLAIGGYLADWLQIKGYLTTTQVRKYITCGGFIAQTIFLMIIGYSMNPTLSVLCVIAAVSLGGLAMSAYW